LGINWICLTVFDIFDAPSKLVVRADVVDPDEKDFAF
jgi:hypothetical protein